MKGPTLLRNNGIAKITINDPVLSQNNLSLLLEIFEELADLEPTRPIVLHSNHPQIFLAGAHLKEIAALDTHSCVPYARLGRHLISTLEKHPTPTVAAVHGACAGGGLDLILAFDSVVYNENASFAHPGVKRGLVTGWGGTLSLPSAISRPAARHAFAEGNSISANALGRCGFISVPSDQDVVMTAIMEARRLGGLNPKKIALWRSLKNGRFIDRFRSSMVLNE